MPVTLERIPGAEDRVILSMGPQHPSTHGVLRLVLELEGETVVRAIYDIGYLHTGFEKSFESKTYSQGITLTDRMDYLAPALEQSGVLPGHREAARDWKSPRGRSGFACC